LLLFYFRFSLSFVLFSFLACFPLLDGSAVEFDVHVDESKGGKKVAINVTGPNGSEPEKPQRKRRFEDDEQGGRGGGRGGGNY
jgi:hypothetical protein